MDVRLSAEQRALRDSVAQVVGQLGPATVGNLDDAERTAKLDAAVAAAGWRELRTAGPTAGAAGQPWGSGVEVAVVAEQLGRALADTAFVGPTLAAELRRLAGAPAAGEPETVLLTADLGALAATSAGAVAVDAAGAASALVLVAEGAGWSLGSVVLGEPEAHTDLTRLAAVPLADGAVTPVTDQARPLDDADLTRVLALGLATTAADVVGAMQGTTDLAAAYAKERRQYGAPIGSFQAVQHLCAEAHVLCVGAGAATRYAAWAVDVLEAPEALRAARVAKAHSGAAGVQVAEVSMQVHGGIGQTWEHICHFYARRAMLDARVLGDPDLHLDHLADAMRTTP